MMKGNMRRLILQDRSSASTFPLRRHGWNIACPNQQNTPKKRDWVGIASLILSMVVIYQTYLISRSNTKIEGFETLLMKYDTLFRSDSIITEIEKGQSKALHDLIAKNTSIDSLILLQNKDLIEFRKLEKKANYNKLQAALCFVPFLFPL